MAEVKGFEPLWAVNPNGFQDRLVMTASIHLRVMNFQGEIITSQSLLSNYTLIEIKNQAILPAFKGI